MIQHMGGVITQKWLYLPLPIQPYFSQPHRYPAWLALVDDTTHGWSNYTEDWQGREQTRGPLNSDSSTQVDASNGLNPEKEEKIDLSY